MYKLSHQIEDASIYEKKARFWDKAITGVLALVLVFPFPFARIKAWPADRVISEHLIMPWSHFRICYLSFPEGNAVEEVYRFTWKGEIEDGSIQTPLTLSLKSTHPPILRWQNSPEKALSEIFYEGDLLRVETFWQPLLLWPIKMVLGTRDLYKAEGEGRNSSG